MANTPSSCSTDLLTDLKTKIVFFGNEFPNDDLKDLFRRLQRHSKDRRFPLLNLFLEECSAVIKDEAAKLPQHVQDLIPPFHTVLTLAEHGDFRQGALGAAMESALLCVLQIGMIIGHYESKSLEYDLNSGNTTLAGLSIGIMAAASVSLATSVADLARTGGECVRVSFRLGVYVDEISRSIEPRDSDGTLESWAYVVTGLDKDTVQHEVDKYNAETSNPEITKVFLSAADKNSISVTGPPSRLRNAFRRSEVLRYSKFLALPVYDGLCHASHLYNIDDINFVINGSEPRIPRSRRVQVPLLSSKTGAPFPGKTSGELFTQIGAELLTGTIYLDNVTEGVLAAISNSSMPDCEFVSFRTSIVSKGLLAQIDSDLPQVSVIKQDLIDWSTKDFEPRIPRTPKQSKLAVVGMSCRMPGGGNDLELFWKIMEEGRDVHTTVPPDRFDLTTHYDPSGKTENATQVPFGNFIDRPGFFDAGFFNMSPREAEQTDPMQRLALVTAYEALEMAGYAPNRTPSTNLNRIGTYYGQASDDWRELNGSQNISTYAVPGGERAFGNGRINYFFKFCGPSFNLDTACSSGLAAVNAACSALWAGEADTVLAGGLNVITDPDNYCGLGNAHFLSKTGQCKVWDKDADGYCRADGVGSIVIKRLEDAEADNDNIIATILAGATNHSANAISITHPDAGAQRDNYTQVMQEAGVNPLDVSYIELHGTGTQAGDAQESQSVADIFAPLSPRRRSDQRLRLGAVKCNIGHGEAAAGIASMLKMLLVFQKSMIPPHIGIKTELNPTLPKDLDKRNMGLELNLAPWPRPKGKKRIAVVNSFGAHGGNTTILLEDAPEKQKVGTDPRTTQPITLSAKSKNSLRGNIEAMIAFLHQHPDTDLGDLSYTLCARRIHHSNRVTTAVSSVEQLSNWLGMALEKTGGLRPIPVDAPTVAFAFTGQGAFYTGIGAQLLKEFPYFRSQVTRLDSLALKFGFPSIVPTIEKTAESISSPIITQLTVVIIEIALARLWTLLGVKPSAVIGHSLGEYAALVVAGVLSAADAIFLVGKRAEHIVTNCHSGSHVMLSVRASVEDIAKAAGSNTAYEVSCKNGRSDTVISGARGDIDSTRQALEAAGFKCTQLDIPFAFHTAQMEPMLEGFETLARNVTFKTPSIPIISPLLASCVFDGKSIDSSYLRRASREPVDFVGALDAALDMEIVDEKTIWVDIGPHPVCATFVRNQIDGARTVSSLNRNEDNFTTLAASLATLHSDGVSICWNEYFKPWERAHSLLHLSSYKWNEKDYWIPYLGTWTLDKAHIKENLGKKPALGTLTATGSTLRTSLVHQVTAEELDETTGHVSVVSDIMHPDFLAAVNGHNMNGVGVATSSIWGDMALTLGEYVYKRMLPKVKDVHMNVTNMEVLHAQVAQKVTTSAQLLQTEAEIDLSKQCTSIRWYNIIDDGSRATEAFASATVRYEDPAAWRAEWDRVGHLVLGRMAELHRMAARGDANKLSRNMAYTLFKNVVDYADKYRGMQSVVLHDYEACADITLVPERHGTWHTPPHWIDSVSHLAGLVMNGSDASNTRDFFYVTPGCDSFRLARPLVGGARYRAYVKMFPCPIEPHMRAGDVYIFQDDEVVGMVEQIKFRRVPRVLIDQFFSAPDAKKKATPPARAAPKPAVPAPAAPAPVAAPAAPTATAPALATLAPAAPAASASTVPIPQPAAAAAPPAPSAPAAAPAPPAPPAAEPSNPMVADCMRLIAVETGLEAHELNDDAAFASIGVDSLMSLVLAEKFRAEVGLEVKSSLFIECPTIGEMKGWLEQYC